MFRNTLAYGGLHPTWGLSWYAGRGRRGGMFFTDDAQELRSYSDTLTHAVILGQWVRKRVVLVVILDTTRHSTFLRDTIAVLQLLLLLSVCTIPGMVKFCFCRKFYSGVFFVSCSQSTRRRTKVFYTVSSPENYSLFHLRLWGASSCVASPYDTYPTS